MDIERTDVEVIINKLYDELIKALNEGKQVIETTSKDARVKAGALLGLGMAIKLVEGHKEEVAGILDKFEWEHGEGSWTPKN